MRIETEILNAIVEAGREMKAAEIARAVGIPCSQVHEPLNRLLARALVAVREEPSELFPNMRWQYYRAVPRACRVIQFR